MLETEARWFGEKMSKLSISEVSPVLNVGSSTEKYRTLDQPWIDKYLWQPLKKRCVTIVHMDMKEDPGVNIIGDLRNNRFLEKLSKMQFKAVFCNNLLEHVTDREQCCRALLAVVSDGGYICVSCPYRYPYHLDPIDTMFRPNTHELAALFPCMDVLSAGIVRSQLHRRPWPLLCQLIRLAMPFYKPRSWVHMLKFNTSFLFRDYQATCLILKKNCEVDLKL